MTDGEFIINTSIKENADGSVSLMIVRPRTVGARVVFRDKSEWDAFARAVEAFQSMEGNE